MIQYFSNFDSDQLSLEADVAQSVGVRPSELEGRQFDPCPSIAVCFDFPLFRLSSVLGSCSFEYL